MPLPGTETARSETRAAAVARLLARYAGPLVLYARQLCDTPDDVVQEAFLQLALQPRPPENEAAWLYRVVRNRAISVRRSDRRRRRRETEAHAVRDAWFECRDDELLDADLVADALQTLPADEREVVVAAVWGGLSFREIGELIGTGRSTAHRRYQAALGRLRQQLGVRCPTT